MKPRLPKIRLARRIHQDIFAQTLVLSAPDVFKILPRRCSGRSFVEIYRDLEALPYLLADLAGNDHAILQTDALDRNKGNYISRSHSRMRSLMVIQVNQLGCLSHTPNRRLANRLPVARQGDD